MRGLQSIVWTSWLVAEPLYDLRGTGVHLVLERSCRRVLLYYVQRDAVYARVLECSSAQ